MEYTYSKITKIYIKHLVIKETISKTKKYSFLNNRVWLRLKHIEVNPNIHKDLYSFPPTLTAVLRGCVREKVKVAAVSGSTLANKMKIFSKKYYTLIFARLQLFFLHILPSLISS